MKLTLVLALMAVVMTASVGILRAGVPAKAGADTTSLIDKALADAKPQETGDRLATLQAAAKAVMQAHPNNLLVSTTLQKVLNQPEANDDKQVKSLQIVLSESATILNFRIKKESDLPRGFPQPCALGEIQLKHYPSYRLARAASQKNNTFFRLFNHIKSNKIEMTSPVEMRYEESDQKYQQIDMAFLYGAPDWGKVGDAGDGVIVEDIPAMSTVAIGLTGDFDPNPSTYIDALESWLARNASDYERDGQVRVMGYNSPFVRKSQRFFEIEIPVRKRTSDAEIAKP